MLFASLLRNLFCIIGAQKRHYRGSIPAVREAPTWNNRSVLDSRCYPGSPSADPSFRAGRVESLSPVSMQCCRAWRRYSDVYRASHYTRPAPFATCCGSWRNCTYYARKIISNCTLAPDDRVCSVCAVSQERRTRAPTAELRRAHDSLCVGARRAPRPRRSVSTRPWRIPLPYDAVRTAAARGRPDAISSAEHRSAPERACRPPRSGTVPAPPA